MVMTSNHRKTSCLFSLRHSHHAITHCAFFMAAILVIVSIAVGKTGIDESEFWEFPKPELPTISQKLEEAFQDNEDLFNPQAVLFLVEFRDRKEMAQWIVEIAPANQSPDETQIETDSIETTIYASSGDQITFSSIMTDLEIRTLGPHVYKTSGKTMQNRSDLKEVAKEQISMPRDYLFLGFDRLAELSLRLLQDNQEDNRFSLSAGMEPFPEEVVEKTRKMMIERGINREHLTPVFGLGPALSTFLNVIQSTPGVSDMLKNIVARPIVLQKALVRSRFRCLPSTVETVSSPERTRDQASIDRPFI